MLVLTLASLCSQLMLSCADPDSSVLETFHFGVDVRLVLPVRDTVT